MSLNVQFFTMLAMFGMGSWVGAALDTYGRFLKRPKRARWFVFINDIAFWIVQGLIIFYTLLLVNEGELRFYVFLALLCGYAAYQALFQSFYIYLLEVLIRFVIRTYKLIAKLIMALIIMPIRYISHLTIVLIIGLWKTTLIILAFLLKVVFTPVKWIGLLLWNLVPKKIKLFFYEIAGFLKKIKNLKTIAQKLRTYMNKWWKNFRS
jgi:spore cortex biosynthesis protein YabQ